MKEEMGTHQASLDVQHELDTPSVADPDRVAPPSGARRRPQPKGPRQSPPKDTVEIP